jgi:hypothetical protein
LVTAALLLFGLILAGWWRSRTVPSVFPASPAQNGYVDLLNAAQNLRGSVPANTIADADTAVLNRFLETNRDVLQLVRRGLERPCVVTVQLTTNYVANHMAELKSLKDLAQLLALEAKVLVEQGKAEEAANASYDLIRFGQAIAQGGLTTDVLVGIFCEALGRNALYALRSKLTAEQCRELTRALETIDRNREPLDHVKSREIAFARASNPVSARFTMLVAKPLFDSMLKEAMDKAQETVLRAQAQMRLLMLALAEQAFFLEHGSHTLDLKGLAPQYLSVLPRDPFSESGFIFRSASNTVMIYSVGPNRKDDGGAPLQKTRAAAGLQGDLFADSKPQVSK